MYNYFSRTIFWKKTAVKFALNIFLKKFNKRRGRGPIKKEGRSKFGKLTSGGTLFWHWRLGIIEKALLFPGIMLFVAGS